MPSFSGSFIHTLIMRSPGGRPREEDVPCIYRTAVERSYCRRLKHIIAQ